MKKIIIMRGLPGSGKSTAAEKYAGAIVCSADHYFTGADGVYRFNASKLGVAHAACQERARLACEFDAALILIDNTNIKLRDFSYYVDLAHSNGYKVVLQESESPWKWDVEECAKRNTHGVPLAAIQRMKNIYQPNPDVIEACIAAGVDRTIFV